ncbi:MAG: cold shock domain-containing protein [Acidimicrobiales bacterium]
MASRGRVAEYDDHKGYGYLATEDGDHVFFHCTAIADGTRTIPVGIDVDYDPVTDPRGKPEAANIRPATSTLE